MAIRSVRSNTGSTQSSRAASLSSVSSLGSPVASAANPYALFALRPEPNTLARFSTGEPPWRTHIVMELQPCELGTRAAPAAVQCPLIAPTRAFGLPASD